MINEKDIDPVWLYFHFFRHHHLFGAQNISFDFLIGTNVHCYSVMVFIQPSFFYFLSLTFLSDGSFSAAVSPPNPFVFNTYNLVSVYLPNTRQTSN